MQGLPFIPTSTKIDYLNQLLKVGFDTIDFGSFVSPKAIPQMRDTAEVLEGLHLSDTSSKLLAIVANIRGASDACDFDEITYLGYPLSLSETFQQRNTNRSIERALDDLAEIQELCEAHEKTLVVYLSMGFGNPYGDPYELDYVGEYIEKLDAFEVQVISLADTIGVSEPGIISRLFEYLIPKFPHIQLGAHLHTQPDTAWEKIEAAYASGCRRIDGALKGYGGCPMAKDDLTGNMATEVIVRYLEHEKVDHGLNIEAFEAALERSAGVFG